MKIKICECGHMPVNHYKVRGTCIIMGCKCNKYVEQSYHNPNEEK